MELIPYADVIIPQFIYYQVTFNACAMHTVAVVGAMSRFAVFDTLVFMFVACSRDSFE